jgi:phage repressor protein C with HTH and peptisase S24 domain
MVSLRAEAKTASPERRAEIIQEAKKLRRPLDYAERKLFTAQRQIEKPTPTTTNEPKLPEGKEFRGKAYHQTAGDFQDFDMSKGADGTAWFTTKKELFDDPTSAASAASGKGNIMEREIHLKKAAGWKEMDRYTIDELVQMGFDGAVLGDDVQVFDVSAIKRSN